MRCKDVHILIDLDLLTSTGHVREVITRDFITPVGPWIFPLSRVPMLQHVVPENLLSIPAIDPQPAADAADDAAAASPEFPRHRSITKRRIATYGATELCDGCIRGTYTHTEACRQRFNQLLNHAEPLVEVSGGGIDVAHDDHETDKPQEKKDDPYTLFDTVDHDEQMEKDDVPICPPETDSDVPPTPTSLASTPESGFLNEENVEEELAELVPGGVGRAIPGLPSRQKHGLIIEFCCQENSAISRVANHLGVGYFGITKQSLDITDRAVFDQFLVWLQVEIQESGAPIHLWGSLPCTKWSPWQTMAVHKYGEKYAEKLEIARDESRLMVERFAEAGQLVQLSRGGSQTFEWSKDSTGWDEPVVQQMLDMLDLKPVNVDGCAFGLEINGKYPRHPWLIQTSNERLRKELSSKVCKHEKGFHDALEGSLTTKSGFYNVAMATCIVTTLFPGIVVERVPAMPVVPFFQHDHREREVLHESSDFVFGAIHKLLTRKEMLNSPDALKAIKEEAVAMRDMKVWDDSTVIEKDKLLSQARAKGSTIHLAELMSICSIKFWEVPSKRRYKGRIVFRGDQVRDQWGGAAKFGSMYSTPTNVQAINIAILFGLMKKHELRVADATKAFLQALLDATEETYVLLPPEMWHPSWIGRYHKPAVKLCRALYGHPLASAFWEKHLKRILVEVLGLVIVEGHPSAFYHPQWELLVVVHVDDILASGPSSSQDLFWDALKGHVHLDEVESLSQFLGRFHHLHDHGCVFDMVDYCQEAINLYLDVAGKDLVLRKVSTPYVSDGVLTDADYQITGQVADKASSVLMKLLWVTRLCRPDLAYSICLLAGQVTKWSRNCDKQLLRLISYLNSTKNLCLHLSMLDLPQDCTIDLFCDADLGGCPHTAKSTSGLFLVVRGPQGTFIPITWNARRQTHVARSTADAELNSLAEGLHEELANKFDPGCLGLYLRT